MRSFFIQAIEIHMTYISKWLATIHNVRTAILYLDDDIFIPDLAV